MPSSPKKPPETPAQGRRRGVPPPKVHQTLSDAVDTPNSRTAYRLALVLERAMRDTEKAPPSAI